MGVLLGKHILLKTTQQLQLKHQIKQAKHIESSQIQKISLLQKNDNCLNTIINICYKSQNKIRSNDLVSKYILATTKIYKRKQITIQVALTIEILISVFSELFLYCSADHITRQLEDS